MAFYFNFQLAIGLKIEDNETVQLRQKTGE